MKHAQIRISLVEWLQERKDQTAIQAVAELLGWLIERGYSSLETKMTSLLKDFMDVFVDQSVLRNVPSKLDDRLVDGLPAVFVTCLKRGDTFLFIDTETDLVEAPTGDTAEIPSMFDVEIDIFAPSQESLENNKRLIIDEVIECFGLTESRESLLAPDASIQPFAEAIRETLTIYQPLDENLFQRLRDEKERMMLRELKRRGAVLERDLQELRLEGIEPDRIKRTLDYLSEEEYLLVERKYAIVCNETQEIIFTLPSKEGIRDAKDLECPKCYKRIGTETVMAYYRTTEELKKLLEGSRWMPLLVREALMKTEVRKEDIFTEVRNDEDEIDTLVFHRGRVLVMELKNRPVSLNDAYKLSAKTARLESLVTTGRPENKNDYWEERFSSASQGSFRAKIASPRIGKDPFIPIVITTHDIAKDARDLLEETRDTAQFLENCEGKIDGFIEELIGKIEDDAFSQRLYALTSFESDDSITRLAGVQVQFAFEMWLNSMK